MTFVTILNIVLAVAVIGGVLRLLSWAIISSHASSPSSPPSAPRTRRIRYARPAPVAPIATSATHISLVAG